jgi:hypothetical protein
MDDIGALRERFSKPKKLIPEPPAPRRHRKRLRVYLRVGDEVACGLQLVKLAGGVDINKFGEDALLLAVRERLELLRRGFDDHAWDSLVKLADAKARAHAK